MSMPMGPESSSSPREPTRELLLAQALDVCIEAERRAPGSAAEVIAGQPAWARDELRRLVDLAGSLDSAAASTVMSEDFRAAARERLMQRIGARPGVASGAGAAGAWLTPIPSKSDNVYRIVRRPARWMWRGAGGGLLAAALVAAATLSASASALPGDTLYGLKQAREEIGLRLAADDEARALALLRQADARLDETARLLNQGRTVESAAVAQRYDEVVQRATTAYVVSMDDTSRGDAASARMDTKLSEQQDQLQTLLQTAPEPARADLREALVTTERGRALVSDPRSVERVLGRGAPPRPAAAALPTMAVEDEPTAVPTASPVPPTLVPVVAAAPTTTAVVVEAHEVERVEERTEERAQEGPTVAPQSENRGPSRGGAPAPPARVQPTPSRDQGRNNQRGGDDGVDHNDEVLPAVPVIADDAPAHGEVSSQVEGRRAAPADAGGEATGSEGEGRDGGQPAVVADTRGRSGDTAQRSGDEQQRSGDTAQRAGDEQQRSGDTVQRAGDDQQRSGDTAQRAGDDQQRSGDTAQRAGDDQQRSGDTAQRAGDDQQRSGDTAQRSGDDQQRSGDTAQRAGDDQQRSGDAVQRAGSDQQQPQPQPQTDTRGRAPDDGSQADTPRQAAPSGGSAQVSDSHDGKASDENPTPTPRATAQSVVVSQPARAASGDGNKDGGGDATKTPASTPAPAPTAVRRQPPTPTAARAAGGASTTPKPTDTKSSGGDGNKDDAGH